MKGDLVVVRCWRDEAAIMRVWEVRGDRVCVVAPEEFEAMSEGKSELSPVGFRRVDVFRHRSGYYVTSGKTVDFNGLEPY